MASRTTGTPARAPAIVHAQVAALAARKAERAYTRRMAAALCATLQIPAGQALVPHLTADRRIKTNEDAVAAWIADQLADPDLALSLAVLPTLIDLLSAKLRTIQESAPCW